VILQLPTKKNLGFTLVELLVAAFVSLLTASVAGDLLLSHIRSSERAEAIERQRNEWSRTASFLEAEIALSERVFSKDDKDSDGNLLINIPEGCNFSTEEFRLGLDQSRSQDTGYLPPTIYAVKTSNTGWLGNNTLWRCGPPLDIDGRPQANQALSVAPVLDGLDDKKAGNGFDASTINQNQRKVTFRLSLKGHHSNITFSQADSSRARISPLFSRPSENSLCSAANYVRLEGTTGADTLEMSIGQVLAGEDVLICGRGGGDTITGSDLANDILEAGDAGSSTLRGKSGNDILRGTNDGDKLFGGDGDDVLIGRGGNDLLDGGSGKNDYLPGLGEDTIDGQNGLDIVFYTGNKNDYDIQNCSKDLCTVIKKVDDEEVSRDTLKHVEILIFKDGRYDPP